MVTPTLDPKTNGRFGQIEVLAGPDDALYYRVFGRGKEEQGRAPRRRAARQGQADRRLRRQRQHADDDHVSGRQYLPPAIEKQIYEPIVLPKGQMGNGIAACRAEMTVDGQTKEIWLSRSETASTRRRRVPSRSATRSTRSMYDVDRKPLGFELKLDDFEWASSPAPSRRPSS